MSVAVGGFARGGGGRVRAVMGVGLFEGGELVDGLLYGEKGWYLNFILFLELAKAGL